MIRVLLAVAVALAPAPALALALAEAAEDRAGLLKLQSEDLRLQAIGWRLATANAPFCNARPSIGLLLQDMANYAEPARMRAASGIAGDVAVQAAAPDSPAARAGLDPNDEVLAIDGRAMTALPAAKAGDWQRLTSLHDAVDAALARDGSVTIRWREPEGNEREARLAGVPACPTRFELLDSGGRAVADGTRVVIGRKFAGIGYAEDELAAALAHEFAHNLLAHRARLKAAGRSQKNIRLTEREADRLMPWLLANAGYDPHAAVRFFERWGPGNDGWIFRARTHDGWDERAAAVGAEIESMRLSTAQEGGADWRTRFRREPQR